MQNSKVCDFVKDDILRVGGKAVARLSRLSRAPQSAEHAMVAAASVQPVSGGRRAGAGSAGFRCVFLGSGDDSPCATRDRDPLIHRVRWWPETEPGR